MLVSPNEGDWYLGPAARYQVTDALSATVGLNLFGARGARSSASSRTTQTSVGPAARLLS